MHHFSPFAPARSPFAFLLAILLLLPTSTRAAVSDAPAAVRVGAAAVELGGDDGMVIAGGIGPGKATGQEGKLRAVATVLEKNGVRLALVACDVLMMPRQFLDPVVRDIERSTGIPAAHTLINCTHTHHAPSTMRVHDYGPDDPFTRQVQAAIVRSVQQAVSNLVDARFQFHLGYEQTVGQTAGNSSTTA